MAEHGTYAQYQVEKRETIRQFRAPRGITVNAVQTARRRAA